MRTRAFITVAVAVILVAALLVSIHFIGAPGKAGRIGFTKVPTHVYSTYSVQLCAEAPADQLEELTFKPGAGKISRSTRHLANSAKVDGKIVYWYQVADSGCVYYTAPQHTRTRTRHVKIGLYRKGAKIDSITISVLRAPF